VTVWAARFRSLVPEVPPSHGIQTLRQVSVAPSTRTTCPGGPMTDRHDGTLLDEHSAGEWQDVRHFTCRATWRGIAEARDDAAAERDTIAGARDETATERVANDRVDADRERARLEKALRGARFDDLTGLARRKMGRLALTNEIDRARRGDGRFVVAFVDVDGLKRVNDRDGHAAGDQVLRTLAATLRSNLRSFDPIVRYGGDEFVCGLGGVDPEGVERRFSAIDQELQDAVGVGITVGLASLLPNDTLDKLISRADAALLDGKRRRDE
jgi:diguanylate cyclase (GGDEF)-like protein